MTSFAHVDKDLMVQFKTQDGTYIVTSVNGMTLTKRGNQHKAFFGTRGVANISSVVFDDIVKACYVEMEHDEEHDEENNDEEDFVTPDFG